MSYDANGGGRIRFTGVVDKASFEKMLDILNIEFSDVEPEREPEWLPKKESIIHVHNEGKYYDDEMLEALDEVAAMARIVGCPVKEGMIEWTGQDGDHWRFVYGESWHKEQGRIEYEDISTREVIDAFVAYVSNDLEAAEPDYVRGVLTDVCGLDKNQLKAIGLDYLFEKRKEETA